MDEESALKVEAAVIDLLGIDCLTNRQRGHGSRLYGKMTVNEIENRYSTNTVKKSEITENTLLIRLTAIHDNNITNEELYEATRKAWRLDLKTAQKVKYAFAVHDGVVLDVYSIKSWFPAEESTTPKGKTYTRYGFQGEPAPDNIHKKFINRSVADFFKKGATNPVQYIWTKTN